MAPIQQRVRDLRAAGEAVIDFSIGDPVEPTWPEIPAVVAGAVPSISQYPTTKGLPELRAAIASYVARRCGVEVDTATQVMPTSGSKEAIFSSALAFVDRGRRDVVGFPDPAYPVYARGAALAGAEAVAVDTSPGFVLTSDSVPTDLWPRLAMLWTCSPSNPTGSVASAAVQAALLDACREHQVWLCADECYLDLYEEDPPVSILSLAGSGAPGVLAFLSLSKRSGMTGYRSGAIVGDPVGIARLNSLRSSTGTASPEFIQAGAVAAWSDDEHVGERRRIFAEKRSILRAGLEDAGIGVVASRAGIYVWVAVDDDLEAAAALAEAGVVVSPGRIFGAAGRGFLRLALVPDVDGCRQALGVLTEVLGTTRA